MIHHGEDDTKIPPGTAVNTLTFDQDTLLGLQAPPWSMSNADAQSVTGQVYSLVAVSTLSRLPPTTFS